MKKPTYIIIIKDKGGTTPFWQNHVKATLYWRKKQIWQGSIFSEISVKEL